MPIRNFLKAKGVVRGRSLAFIITVSLHVALFLGAGFWVAMSVLQREEPRFEGKQISRPKMEIKKLQMPVQVKKIRQPKFKQTMAAPTTTSMDFKMPAMGGLKGAGGNLGGGGLGSLGFGISFDTLFGGDASVGNELVGVFYDLKQSETGDPVTMNDKRYCYILKTFMESSWKPKILEEFFRAPKKKHTLALIVPVMDAKAAPDAFGVGDIVEPKHWVIHYQGEITAPETGRYRFCGLGDDVLIVRINRKIVMDASWSAWRGKITDWESRAPETGKFQNFDTPQSVVYGDWIRLKKGQPVAIEILLGEIPGGKFSCSLLIEQAGKTYKQITVAATEKYEGGVRSVLPIFKLGEIPAGLKEKMKINPAQCTLEGPIFGAGY